MTWLGLPCAVLWCNTVNAEAGDAKASQQGAFQPTAAHEIVASRPGALYAVAADPDGLSLVEAHIGPTHRTGVHSRQAS